MLVCRQDIAETATVREMLEGVQQDFMDGIPHQQSPLAEVQHSLRLAGQPLFNFSIAV